MTRKLLKPFHRDSSKCVDKMPKPFNFITKKHFCTSWRFPMNVDGWIYAIHWYKHVALGELSFISGA